MKATVKSPKNLNLSALITRAGRLGYNSSVSKNAVNLLRITTENGVHKTVSIRIEKRPARPEQEDRTTWEPSFNQFIPMLKELNLELRPTDTSMQLYHVAEGMLAPNFPYNLTGVRKMATFISDIFLSNDNKLIKIRPRYWENGLATMLNKELDVLEAVMESQDSDDGYRELAELFWCRMTAIQQEACITEFTGKTKQRLEEIIKRLHSNR